MELDKRIKSIDSIRSFNTNNDDCLGRFGYFTNFITNFDDLNSIRKGICVFKDGSRFPFYVDSIASQKFQFFVPESELLPKEKKYRPYTLQEFFKKFPIGKPIIFRQKGATKYERHLIINGYSCDDWSGLPTSYICIGSIMYSLDALFIDYEYKDDYTEDFKPFGVEVE